MRAIALFLTVLTGFSGLVYQVVWQKYLAALLGSHSEATAAVLGIFLGGLSYGYLLFGRVSRRLVAHRSAAQARSRVVFAYGLVEVGIGVYALAFGSLFALARSVSLALPAGHETFAFGFDVALTALLIGPPTILMGGTIPLLTQGLSRDLGDSTRFHAWIYATNTVGAFAGALCAGFVLVPTLGLHRSVIAMGVVNLAAGGIFLASARRDPHHGTSTPTGNAPDGNARLEDAEAARAHRTLEAFPGFAAAALLSGFAMMTLQTALNRIGALSLGASQFTFSMVVATFVLSIAIGSFAVSILPRIPRSVLPLSQWLLVAYLVLLYAWVDDAPYWAHRLRIAFGLTDADFLAFHASVLGALLVILVVPLGVSGALLPLIFHALRRSTADLGRVAGSLYSWNTLGSLLGALLGGYALFFWLDLHHVYRLAVLALAGSAALLSARGLGRLPASRAVWSGTFGAVALLLAMLPAWSPVRLSAGLFRIREPFAYSYLGPNHLFEQKRLDMGADFVRFYRDDPIVSIAVHETAPGSRSIVTNGKVDGNIPRDDKTQGLLGLLPALVARGGERAFVIGYGTGMTVGELAALSSFEEVVVAEISTGVIDAAPHFEALNRGALHNPKTRLVRSDAYRALLRSDGVFDVIVSEPSNPWVTGVEMLYSREFLEAARGRLAEGGVFAQWFHLYETDDASLQLVLRTYLDAFDRVAVWQGEAADLILLGFAGPAGDVDLGRVSTRFERPDFRTQLADLGLATLPRLLAHEILPAGSLERAALPGFVHTLEVPRLSHAAARAFFRGGTATLATVSGRSDVTSVWSRYRAGFEGGMPRDADRLELLRETCVLSLDRCARRFARWLHEDPASPALAESLAKARASRRYAEALEPERLRGLAALFDARAEAGF